MCRALIYLGEPVLLDNLLFQPDSALVRQIYTPKMLHMLNLAGFGLRAWAPFSHCPEQPFSYASTALAVFDRNLKNLAEKVCASAVLAHVRGVSYSTNVDISIQNVHPFQFPGVPLVMAHNGDLHRMGEMKPELAEYVRPELLPLIRGTTDSEWIYALVVSFLPEPTRSPSQSELTAAIRSVIEVLQTVRRKLGIDISSPINLFFADGQQVAAVRFCFDFGCYQLDAPERLHESSLSYLSLWYTLGRDYAQHDGEWKMIGGAENANSLLIASEPLTRDLSGWVELPEYSMLHAEIVQGRPQITVTDLA